MQDKEHIMTYIKAEGRDGTCNDHTSWLARWLGEKVASISTTGSSSKAKGRALFFPSTSVDTSEVSSLAYNTYSSQSHHVVKVLLFIRLSGDQFDSVRVVHPFLRLASLPANFSTLVANDIQHTRAQKKGICCMLLPFHLLLHLWGVPGRTGSVWIQQPILHINRT